MSNVSSLDAAAQLAAQAVQLQQQPLARSSSPTMDAQVQGVTKGLDPAKGADDSKSAEIDNKLLRELIERANTQYRSRSISLNFAVDKEAARTVITVVDQKTEKVIRQIPPDEILALIRNMKRMQMQLFDTEA